MKRFEMNEFENLRKELLCLPAAGEKGVEGLVAHALSSLTLRSFRLARSGRQHGRDGATTPGSFDIFFEAKAYSETSPSTEDLLAKFFSAISSHKPNLDVWVLAATTAINENSISALKELADEHGITILLADWSEHPIPVLAALLAATSEATKEWFEHHTSSPVAKRISGALAEIKCHPAYDPVIEEIKGELTAATTGWPTAKQKNKEWLIAQFSSRSSARRAFGQYLSPKDVASHPVERTDLNARLSEAMLSASGESLLVAVLGDEGTGKTWLTATAWLSMENRPMLLLATSDIVFGEKELQDPLSLLAEVLDWQTGGSRNPENIQRWRRRLDNWRKYDTKGAPRVIFVLDGLNERESKRWIRLIDRLTDTAANIGLRIVVTSRKAFFARHIELSLSGYSVKKIDVTPFSDTEISAALAQVGQTVDNIPLTVRDFIRNPRVFSVAASLLDRLNPDELSHERLLFEYWRKRKEERGDGLRHDDAEIRELLISHATKVRERIQTTGKMLIPSFRRSMWKTHSGLAQRVNDPSIDDELTEIEEGHFFQPDPNNGSDYRLRVECIPFALALLLIDELKQAVDTDSLIVALDGALDPIREFDLASDVLLAAVGVACVDQSCSDELVAQLLCTVIGQQNLRHEGPERLRAYVGHRITAYILCAETLWANSTMLNNRLDWAASLLYEHRLHSAVQPALDAAIQRWLGIWSREPEYLHMGGGDSEQQKKDVEDHERYNVPRKLDR